MKHPAATNIAIPAEISTMVDQPRRLGPRRTLSGAVNEQSIGDYRPAPFG
jgi:hypothetical protein